MPVVNCPNCRAELEIDDADFGYRMQCPACHSAFTPDASPTQPPPPPPPPAEPETRVVTCPRCQGKVGVVEADLGHDLRCPLCERVFTATTQPSPRDDDSPPWRGGGESGRLPRYDDEQYDRRRSRYDDEDDYDRPRRRRSRYDNDDDTPEDLIAYAKRECGSIGVGIIVIGVLTILVGLLRIGAGAMGGMGGPLGPGGAGGPGAPNQEVMMLISIGYGVYSLVIGGFLIYAGMQMREAKNYGLCMIASIFVIIPVLSPCCILGLIFGIMGITKLNEPRVKLGFEANKPGYQSDGYN